MLCTAACMDGTEGRSSTKTRLWTESPAPAPLIGHSSAAVVATSGSPRLGRSATSGSPRLGRGPTRKETRMQREQTGTLPVPNSLTKDDILAWMLVCSEEDAGYVLSRISFTRSNLLRQEALQEKDVTEWLLAVKQDCCERVLQKVMKRKPSSSTLMQVFSRGSFEEQAVTDWLLMAEHGCLERCLQALARERAQTLEEALTATLSNIQTAAKRDKMGSLLPPVAPPSPDGHMRISVGDEDTDLDTDGGATIISLASPSYFSTEGEPWCEIDVMRVGNLEKATKVCYQTNPGSAKPGKTYQHTAGTLEFLPGEAVKFFRVPLIDDDEWNTTLEFEVVLLREKMVNGTLDPYLTNATVKVIDNDAFPTNKYKKEIAAHAPIPGPGLLMEYFRLNRGNPIIRIGTTKVVIVDQLSNLYFLMKLFMNIYLVDYVLSPEMSDDDLVLVHSKEGSLGLLLAATLVPFAVVYYLEQKKFAWKVPGTSRAILQKSLLRKFLNYEEESRSKIDKGDLVMAMTRDAFKVVHDGYMNFLDLIKEVGKILLVLAYQFAVPFVFGRPLRLANIFVPFFTFPILLISFLMWRKRVTTRNFMTMNELQDVCVESVEQAVTNYRLIADYDARSACVDNFEGLIKRFNAAFTATSAVLGVNNYFPKWVTVCVVSLYVYYAGQETIGGGMTLGIFLADVQVFTQVGDAWGIIYKVLLEMQTCFPAMERIVRLENLPTDVPQRSRLMKHNRKITNKLRQEITNVDEMAITVNNLQISSSGKGGAINNKGNLRIQQGHLVALVGNRGQGKATMLKVLSSVILPRTDVEDPGFFMPPHLRVLHISLEPMFYKGSLMDNLTFGAKGTTDDGSPDRVRRICERLHLGEEALRLLDSGEEQDWGETLSQTTKAIINLARAFVANPEVMCIHKPTQVFDQSMSHNVMKCVAEFVRKRGLEENDHTWSMRRPRTCIFTSSEAFALDYADSIVHLSKSFGIRILEKQDVTSEMFS